MTQCSKLFLRLAQLINRPKCQLAENTQILMNKPLLTLLVLQHESRMTMKKSKLQKDFSRTEKKIQAY